VPNGKLMIVAAASDAALRCAESKRVYAR
jgi:hypothetical protein